MDPVSRRDLWGVISRMVVGESSLGNKTSVILTTHSMEECEALCPRIGIMAGGKMKCIGSAQHLKTRFGKGYQVDIKVDEPVEDDDDLKEVVGVLLENVPEARSTDPESGTRGDIFFNEEEALSAARKISKDDFISNMITEDDPVGYVIYKNTSSDVGVELNELAAFCATQLRMKQVKEFFSETYPNSILRETQDTRMRYEVSSEGNKISSLFASVESNKVNLHLQDYGISQTTLEQVFNMHAAHEEAKKQGTDDR
jgi:ABC-type multidrug transport system ATPase subunit